MIAFHRALRKIFINAFSNSNTSPETIASLLNKCAFRPCSKKTSADFSLWQKTRNIDKMIHFTRLENVPWIIRYGLIPREYLELNLLKMVIAPYFSDSKRLDQKSEFNCTSLTFPNYKMFYQKRRSSNHSWAVIVIDSKVLEKYFFSFTKDNLAGANANVFYDCDGAEQLFERPQLRRQLSLNEAQPTNPQSEALCDSIIHPDFILDVQVDSQKSFNWLSKHAIKSEGSLEYFSPRSDFEYWKAPTVAS